MLTIIANILILLAIPYMVWRKAGTTTRAFFWPALILRVSASLFIGVLYNGYYTGGDTWMYFDKGSAIANLITESPVDYLRFLWTGQHTDLPRLAEVPPRALFFTNIVSFFALLSGFNYWISACYFSLVSFLASWFLVKEIELIKPRWTGPAVFAFLFMPSVVFWSSGLIKESLAMSMLYFLVFLFLRLWSGRRTAPYLWLLLPPALWVLWGLKYYYAAVLLPVLITELIMNRIIRPRFSSMKWHMNIAVWIVLLLGPVSLVIMAHPNLYPNRFLEVIVANYETFQSISSPDDVVRYPGLAPDIGSMFSHSPRALVTALFRPFPWEADGPLKLIAATENVLIAVLFLGFLTALMRRQREVSTLALPVLLYCLFLAVFLALSTPNLGTLSRYRVGFLPFLMLLISADNLLVSWLAGRAYRSDKHLVQ